MINDEMHIKMMIMFALRSAGGMIPSDTVAQIIDECGIGQIRTAGELFELRDQGHISLITDDGTEYAVLEKTGREIVSALGRDLSSSLREKIILTTAKEIAKLRKDLEIMASYKERHGGGYDVCFTLKDEGEPLMDLKMYAPTTDQANIMITSFKNDPYRVYREVLASLSKKES